MGNFTEFVVQRDSNLKRIYFFKNLKAPKNRKNINFENNNSKRLQKGFSSELLFNPISLEKFDTKYVENAKKIPTF